MVDKIEAFIIEKIEDARGFVRGDFLKAVDVFWYTLKFFMSQPECAHIKIEYWGSYIPGYKVVKRNAVRELKKVWASKGKRSREKLYHLVRVRRKLIDEGKAPKMYYYRKLFRNARPGQRYQAEGAFIKGAGIELQVGTPEYKKTLRDFQSLCGRLQRFSEARNPNAKNYKQFLAISGEPDEPWVRKYDRPGRPPKNNTTSLCESDNGA